MRRRLSLASCALMLLLTAGCNSEGVVRSKTEVIRDGKTVYIVNCRVGYQQVTPGQSQEVVERREVSKAKWDQTKVGDSC